MTEAAKRITGAVSDRYRIERQLGAGGMATVYLAHDLKHDRQVAIKVLHEDLGATLGPDRFLAEIKTTAKLQHPHILTLLDSGSAGGLLYYVMTYVAGESLRDRLNREKQLPIGDATRIASEVADALAHAHGHGVVHRDIKPENILLQDGHALVADFGIALAVQSAGAGRMTQTGLSLGTPQYMAPEQAMGDKSVDSRADIYALGAVTYEMLIGEPPFTGATVQAIVAKVMTAEPEPPTTMRKTIPHHVEDAVLTALAKLPADRFAKAAEFAAALAGGASSMTSSGARGVSPRARSSGVGIARRWAVAGIAVGLFAGVALGYLAWRGNGADRAGATVSRSYLLQPTSESFALGTSEFALSPDGGALVYAGPGETPGAKSLWIKRRGELHATRISGTAGGSTPFFSPDGKSIAYFTPAGFFRLDLAGGAPLTLSPGAMPRGEGSGYGAWLDDGRIVLVDRTRLNVVPSAGGAIELVTGSNALNGYNPVQANAIPGTSKVLLQACPALCPRARVYIADVEAKSVKLLLEDGRYPAWLPTGHIAYITSRGVLEAVTFDPASGTVGTNPVTLVEQVSAFSVSRGGDLVYREGRLGDAYRLVLVDRTGKWAPVDTAWRGRLSTFAVSPDGRRVAFSQVENGQHIWVKDLPDGVAQKLTTDDEDHFRPVWSRDGRQLRYVRSGDSFGISEKNVNGSGGERPVPNPGHHAVEGLWSRDGQWFVQRTGGPDTSRTVSAMRTGLDTVPRLIPKGAGAILGLALSPDNKFIAYLSVSSQGSQAEVYVSPFPNMTAARWQVSVSGGAEPRWSADGRELYYVNAQDELIVAKLKLDGDFSVLSQQKLFSLAEYARDSGYHMYELDQSGSRFYMLRAEAFPGVLVMVSNWMSEVREKLKSQK